MKTKAFLQRVWGLVLLAVWLSLGQTGGAATLSKELAPDIPREISEKLLPAADVYLTGPGSKEVWLLADPFCENSRKVYRQLMESHREQCKSVRILWVAVYPQKGSDVMAAAAMKMRAAGGGEVALAKVFGLDIPPAAQIALARENALRLVNEQFAASLGKMDLVRLRLELDDVERNTHLANSVGYTGTPHFIVDGRVLHGYSGPAIRILMRQ